MSAMSESTLVVRSLSVVVVGSTISVCKFSRDSCSRPEATAPAASCKSMLAASVSVVLFLVVTAATCS